MMRRIAVLIAALAILCSGTANATTGLAYIVSETPSQNGASMPTPAGGTCLAAFTSVNNTNGCTCPSGWSTITNATATGGGMSHAACYRLSASASATYDFKCNSSTTGVAAYEIALNNVASGSCAPEASSHAAATSAALTSATASLTTDYDLEIQHVDNGGSDSAFGGYLDNTTGQTIIDAQGFFGVGFLGYGYNPDHTDPITVKFDGNTTGLVSTVWFAPSSAVSKTLNHFIPYRDFTETPKEASSATSASYTPNPWIANGDLMLCYNHVRAVANPTCDAAWTPIGTVQQNAAADGSSFIVCDKKAGSNEHANTYTFGAGAGGPYVQTVACGAFHNIDLSGAAPYTDATAFATSGTSYIVGTAGVTPSKNGDLIVNIGFKDLGELGGWFGGDVPMPSADTIGPSNATTLTSAHMAVFIQPTVDPTGIHNMRQTRGTGATQAAMIAFKTTPPTVSTVCGAISIRGGAVPMTTDSQPHSGGSGTWQRNPHYVAYGAQTGDIMVSTDDTDASIIPASSAYVPFGNLTGPTIRANSNNGAETNNEAVITTPITWNSPPFMLTKEAGNIVPYGMDATYAAAAFESACGTNPAAPSPRSGCPLTPLETGDLAIDGWDAQNAVTVASNNLANSIIAGFGANFAQAAGSKCLSTVAAYTPTASDTTSNDPGQTTLLLTPSGSPPPPGTATSLLFGPICGFAGDACGN